MNKFRFICVGLFFVGVLSGCKFHSSMAYTYNVETGDQVKVSLDTTDGYGLTSDIPFNITLDDETVSQGTFIKGEYYTQYVEAANTDPLAKVIDSGTKDGNEYVFWNYNEEEYNYVVMVQDSNTGILIGNTVSEESAKDCFDCLTISIEE